MDDTLSERVEECCKAFGDSTATFEASGTPVSFKDLFLTLLAFAERLEDRGVRQGQRAVIEVGDAIAGTLLSLALLRLGAVVLPGTRADLNTSHNLDVDWRVHQSTGAGPDEIGVDPSWISSPRRIVPVSGKGMMVRSTSGTTGTPKLRAITEAGLLARVEHGLRFRGAPDGPAFIGYRPNSSPGVNMFLRTLVSGQPQLHQLATPEATLDAMDRCGVAVAYCSPYNFNRLLQAATATGKRVGTLRRLMVGGGPVSPQTAAEAEAVFGCVVLNSYGSNETGSIADYRVAQAPNQPGLVGRIYDDFQIEFKGSDGKPAEPADGSLIRIRVPEQLRLVSYPSMQPICDADGWVETGDIGHMLPDGMLRLTGRASEFLNVGGTKRAPGFFEAVARQFPNIRSVVAFRAPVENGMDHVGLAVEPADGFDLNDFAQHMITYLGPTYPMQVAVLECIPVNAAGKVDRKKLTTEFLKSRATMGQKTKTQHVT